MSFLRTSLRLSSLRNRIPGLRGLRASKNVGGFGVGAQVTPQGAAQAVRQSLDLDDLLKGARDEAIGIVIGTVERGVVPEAPAAPAPPRPRTRRQGPATLLERRDRLNYSISQLARPGAHIEFQSNTIAVINPGNIIVRLLRFVIGLPLIPLRWLAHAVEWVFRPRGAGRLKRTVVFVDRRGNVVVYRM